MVTLFWVLYSLIKLKLYLTYLCIKDPVNVCAYFPLKKKKIYIYIYMLREYINYLFLKKLMTSFHFFINFFLNSLLMYILKI